jgi:hypothetical protein
LGDICRVAQLLQQRGVNLPSGFLSASAQHAAGQKYCERNPDKAGTNARFDSKGHCAFINLFTPPISLYSSRRADPIFKLI